MIDLNNLARQSLKIAEHRKLETDIISCLKHCAGEVIEANEAYNNWTFNVGEDMQFQDELADVIMCILTASAKENIDIEKALLKCLEKNRRRARTIYETDKHN